MQDNSKLLNKYVADYTLFDLETTGFSRENDEIVEVSAVKVRGGVIVDEFSSLVNPGMKMPLEAMQVNHITDAMLKDAPPIKKVLPPFFRFVGNDILVGHNIHSFDMPFIYRDCKKYFDKTPPHSYIDTLKFARSIPLKVPGYGLGALAEFFGLNTDGAHRALFDCRMNQQVFEELGRIAANEKELPVCPLCGSVLKKRKGSRGEFFGCSSYPSCKFTKNI